MIKASFSSGFIEIQTIEGPKWLRDIKVGDLVLTHLNRYKRVTKVFAEEMETFSSFDLGFYIEDSNTEWHEEFLHRIVKDQLFITNGKIKKIQDLRKGDLLTYRKKKVKVNRVLRSPKKDRCTILYRIEVEIDHSYFAEGILITDNSTNN